jgi:dTDP-4-amino-4,6-dideoxygalactose transaminase
MRNAFLPFAIPDCGEAELTAIAEVVRSGWITTGPKVKEFESRFAEAVGARHAIAVNSCTAAMHVALEAMGVTRGDEVITTPYTFAATAEVIRYLDARPVFVDVDPRCLNIRAENIEEAITPRTKAIVPVHIAGLPADLDSITTVARRHGIPVLEDAAHAFPSHYHGRMIGSVGEMTAFSFYATKTITTAEGGMLTTDNDAWADRCRIMALHGISRDAWKRYTAEGSWYYEIVAPGFKYNMTDIAAAMGLVQLGKAQRMLDRRKEIAAAYDAAFEAVAELEIPHKRADVEHAWHLYMLRLDLDALRIDRAGFVEELKRRNIGVSVHFIPLHVHPYYSKLYGHAPDDFPVAYRQYLREVSLPIYSAMTDKDVADVAGAVLEVADGFRK